MYERTDESRECVGSFVKSVAGELSWSPSTPVEGKRDDIYVCT